MIAKRTEFVRGNRRVADSKLADHFKYLQHRTRGEHETREDRAIFSQDQDQVSRRQALDAIMQRTSTSVNYHKIVLSPSKDEPIHDWQEWTRNVMNDLADHKGQTAHLVRSASQQYR